MSTPGYALQSMHNFPFLFARSRKKDDCRAEHDWARPGASLHVVDGRNIWATVQLLLAQ